MVVSKSAAASPMPMTSVDELSPADRVLVGDTPQIRALVAAAREGDRTAFDELVAIYHRTVFRTAMAALGRREDAEDATQDAFVLAWRKVSHFRGDSTFKTWILTIVWRQALDRRRSRSRWWQRTSSWRVGDSAAHDDMDRLISLEADPERQSQARHRIRQVRQAMDRLSPKLRDTLLLAASGDHGYSEIAQMLRVPVGTVKWRVAEARRLIQRELS